MGAGERSSRKVSGLRRLGLVAIAVLALTGLAGCFPQGGGGAPPITYQVFTNGGAGASVTYTVPGGIQQEDVPTGWSRDIGYTDFASVLAQNNSALGGAVECVLIRNGVVLVHNVSHGPFAIVSCDHFDFNF